MGWSVASTAPTWPMRRLSAAKRRAVSTSAPLNSLRPVIPRTYHSTLPSRMVHVAATKGKLNLKGKTSQSPREQVKMQEPWSPIGGQTPAPSKEGASMPPEQPTESTSEPVNAGPQPTTLIQHEQQRPVNPDAGSQQPVANPEARMAAPPSTGSKPSPKQSKADKNSPQVSDRSKPPGPEGTTRSTPPVLGTMTSHVPGVPYQRNSPGPAAAPNSPSGPNGRGYGTSSQPSAGALPHQGMPMTGMQPVQSYGPPPVQVGMGSNTPGSPGGMPPSNNGPAQHPAYTPQSINGTAGASGSLPASWQQQQLYEQQSQQQQQQWQKQPHQQALEQQQWAPQQGPHQAQHQQPGHQGQQGQVQQLLQQAQHQQPWQQGQQGQVQPLPLLHQQPPQQGQQAQVQQLLQQAQHQQPWHQGQQGQVQQLLQQAQHQQPWQQGQQGQVQPLPLPHQQPPQQGQQGQVQLLPLSHQQPPQQGQQGQGQQGPWKQSQQSQQQRHPKQQQQQQQQQEAVQIQNGAQPQQSSQGQQMPGGSADAYLDAYIAGTTPQPSYNRPQLPSDGSLSDEHLKWFQTRGIGPEVLQANGVCTARNVYIAGIKAHVNPVAFPYRRRGELVNIKYRQLPKVFQQVKGAEKIVYGYDNAIDCDTVVIVEGEIDKLSFNEAGIWNVVSVPDGAPAAVRTQAGGTKDEESKSKDVKFSYIWQCKELFDNKHKIVLATDNDGPGDALAEELARRLGRERCWRVRWPKAAPPKQRFAAVEIMQDTSRNPMMGKMSVQQAVIQDRVSGSPQAASGQLGANDADTGFRKDANDVLVKDGPARLVQLLEYAEPTPINGLFRFREYENDILRYYEQEDPTELGVSTGWPSMDPYYKVVPGELTIVTGIPNSGKSEWIDALLTNLANEHYWCFALCSLEKKPRDHAKQLLEKRIGKPFFHYITETRQRMTEQELADGMEWLEDHFHVIMQEDEPPTIDWVLEVARMAVMRYGIRGLVVDPYNELDHTRPAFMSETEYVSHMLSKVKRFAQMYGVHVWFVAHPKQLQNWHGQAPSLYDISGSANFINKADNGIVVHRVWNLDKKALHQSKTGYKDNSLRVADQVPALQPNEVQILVRKVRNKAAGMVGDVTLVYDRPSGRYKDQQDAIDMDGGQQDVMGVEAEASSAASSYNGSHVTANNGAGQASGAAWAPRPTSGVSATASYGYPPSSHPSTSLAATSTSSSYAAVNGVGHFGSLSPEVQSQGPVSVIPASSPSSFPANPPASPYTPLGSPALHPSQLGNPAYPSSYLGTASYSSPPAGAAFNPSFVNTVAYYPPASTTAPFPPSPPAAPAFPPSIPLHAKAANLQPSPMSTSSSAPTRHANGGNPGRGPVKVDEQYISATRPDEMNSLLERVRGQGVHLSEGEDTFESLKDGLAEEVDFYSPLADF